MEIDHAGNVLPAPANHLFACVILLNSSDKPIVESLQVLAAFHWHSFSMIFLPAVLLHLQIDFQQADSVLCLSSDLSLTWYLLKVSFMAAPAAETRLYHIS